MTHRIGLLCENMTSSTDRKYIAYRNADSGEPSHGHMYNMHTQFLELRHVVSKICEQTDKQTDRHAHHNISHPSMGVDEVIKIFGVV